MVPFVFQVASAFREFLLEHSGEHGVDFSIGTPPTSIGIRMKQMEILFGADEDPFKEHSFQSWLFGEVAKMVYNMGRYEPPGGRDKLVGQANVTIVSGGARKALELWEVVKTADRTEAFKNLAAPVVTRNMKDILMAGENTIVIYSDPLMERCSLAAFYGPLDAVHALQSLHTSLLGTPSAPQQDLYFLLSNSEVQKFLENGGRVGDVTDVDMPETEENCLSEMVNFLSLLYREPLSSLAEEAQRLRKSFSHQFLSCFFEHLSHHSDFSIVCGNGGGRQALHGIEKVLVQRGVENMILFQPHWTYSNVYTSLKLIALPAEESGEPDFEILQKNLIELTENGAKKNVAITINSPNNPTGVVYPQKILEQILKLAEKYSAYVIDDACYIQILRKEEKSRSTLIDVADALAEKNQLGRPFLKKILVALTASKGLGMAGARLGGILYADENFTIPLEENYSRELPNMMALYFANILTKDRLTFLELLKEINAEIDQRVEKVTSILDAHGIEYRKPAGAFYLEIKVPFLREQIEKKRLNDGSENQQISAQNMKDFSLKMAREKGIAFMPMEVFGGEQYAIRLSLGGEKTLTQLQEETEILLTSLKAG